MLQTLRNTYYDRVRRDTKADFNGDLTEHDVGAIYVDPGADAQERRYAALAFGKLPERWRMVLWHTEVEEDSPTRIATMLGMTPNGVAALAYRAREKLRQNYLSEHAADSPREECRWTVDRIGARVRGRLGERDASKVDHHLDACVTCNLLFAELTELNSGLRGVIAVIFLGGAASPYLAAGAVSAAGLAFGGALVSLFAPFRAVANGVRRIVRRLGAKGAVATGTAVAVAATFAVVALTVGEDGPDPRPAPEDSAVEPADPWEEPQEPGPQPPGPEPEPGPEPDPDDPAWSDTEPADEPEGPAEPASYGIAHGLGSSGLVAGGEAVLPIRLEAASHRNGYAPVTERVVAAPHPGLGFAPAAERSRGQAASDQVTLDITMPSGTALASATAEPGWSCTQTGAAVRCTIASMPEPAEANVRIAIGDEVSGYQTFEVAVAGPGVSGTTAIQVPIAPAGGEVGFASVDATGVTAAGNTWLTCSTPGCQDAVQHGGGDRWPMEVYEPETAPAGRDGQAVSGALLDVPGGAVVQWAGLYWAGVEDALPAAVSLAGPGGSWIDLSAATMRDTDPGQQAFVEVTELVSGGGQYWVATDEQRLPTSECEHRAIGRHHDCTESHWAGWALTAVFAEPGAETKGVAVYDGAPAADTAVGVVDGGEVDIAATLWGGSAYRRGDSVSAGGEGLGEPASCHAHGAVENPHWYAFGIDVNVYRASTGEHAVIRFERGDDPFIVGVLAVATPLGDTTSD
jgi:hypothetical protein